MAQRLSLIDSEQEIHRFVTCEQIEFLHSEFRANNDRLTLTELRDVLARVGLRYTDEQYRALCLQINTNHDEYCEWDEFLDYLIQGFQDDDPLAVKQSLDPPISGELGLKLRRQVYTIVKVDFCPMVYYDGSVSWSQGHWITTSREGVINYWTNDWKLSLSARTVPSGLKRSKTWVLDTVPLPDQSMLCVASLECELRFYEVVASSFTLKTVIERLPQPITAMVYRFCRDEPSSMLFGDTEGCIRELHFYPERKVTEKGLSYSAIAKVSLEYVLLGKYPPMECREFGPVLSDIVRSVRYVHSLGSFLAACEENPFSCSRSEPQVERKCHMIIVSLEQRHAVPTKFYVPRGVTCFAFEPANELLVSGGPDCDLRLWDIRRPEKPTAVLAGHNSSITFLFIQDGGEKIYSMDQKKLIKVWNARNRTLLQTFAQFSKMLAIGVPACAFYNERERELVVASNKLFIASCCPKIALDRTDGESHTKPVSVLLYNSLYRLVVSCALDSFIIVWDHRTNRKMTVITEAHTLIRNGVLETVEITAACFDEKQQLLLTGARDGSLKIWNISARSCVRAFSMEEDREVTAVFWQANRILAMGWNHRVVEFAASTENEEYPRGLQWRKHHSDDILFAAVSANTPKALATCSYSGELVLWTLETGQPYRRYNVSNPRARIPIKFHESDESENQPSGKTDSRLSLFQPSGDQFKQRRLSRIVMPSGLERMRLLSIQALLFLQTRPILASYGTLLGSLDNGRVQVWSHHPDGGFVGQFDAVHMAGDRVISMASDGANKFLFTGTALGYIKTWYIEDCWIPDEDKFKVCKPALRITFPFLLHDVIPGRAKRSARAQPKPWLVNSYQAHRSCVTKLLYMDASELLLSASSDRTIRLWTLGGRYIGLLGSPVHWEPLASNLPPPEGYRFRVPPELQREVSFTTAKVLCGAHAGQRLKTAVAREGPVERSKYSPTIETYGESLREPILNTSLLKLPTREPMLRALKLERSFPRIPVYAQTVQFPVRSVVCDEVVEQILARTKKLKFIEPPRDIEMEEFSAHENEGKWMHH